MSDREGDGSGKLQEELTQLRRDIESIDRRVVELLAERLELGKRTGEIKRDAGKPILDAAREAEVIRRAVTAARGFGCSSSAIELLTAFCTFSNARTSIWRTRSRETPNSAARSSNVIGSSASRRASKMRRSRSLSTSSAEIRA